MKKALFAYFAFLSIFALADDAPLAADVPAESPVTATPLKYLPDRKQGDKIEVAVRIRAQSGEFIRKLQPSQISITIDEELLVLPEDGLSVASGNFFEQRQSASVYLVNISGTMRLLNKSKVARLFSELAGSLKDTSGVVLYGNGINQIDSGWALTAASGTKVMQAFDQATTDNAQIPDPALAVQDAFRKLSEKPIDFGRSLFMITDGSDFESRAPESVAQYLKEVFMKQKGLGTADVYLIDCSNSQELSGKLQQFVDVLNALSDGMTAHAFRPSDTAALLRQIEEDRQIDQRITVSKKSLLPLDGLMHRIEFRFALPDEILTLPGELKTVKVGISYRTFILAGIGIGVFAIIALAILMVTVRKT